MDDILKEVVGAVSGGGSSALVLYLLLKGFISDFKSIKVDVKETKEIVTTIKTTVALQSKDISFLKEANKDRKEEHVLLEKKIVKLAYAN